jgi:hypothetical protein
MKCHEVDDKIREYLAQDSGQLDQKLRQHFSQCDGCRSRYESLLDLEGFLRQAPLMELPPGYDALFYRRLADCRGALKAVTVPAFPLRVLISLTTSGFSWIYWLILSFLLVLGIRHLYPAAPYLPVEFSNSNLPGLMAIMTLALLGAAAAALLQGIPSNIRSEKNED